MNEECVTFGTARTLVGIHHKPSFPRPDLPAVLLLNAGILHRVGPNRLYVNLARRLQQRGHHVLRFDVWGIGDSQDHRDGTVRQTFHDDTVEAMDFLGARAGTQRFMLMGICMGAKISLAVATRDPRVESLVLMEGIYVKSLRYHVARLLDLDKWRRLLTGDSHLAQKIRGRLTRRRNGNGQQPAPKIATTANGNPVLFLPESSESDMRRALELVRARGTRMMLLFRDGNEIAYNYRLRRRGDEIVATGLPPGFDVAFIPFADHTFTPLVSQDLLLGATMRWIESAHAQ